MQVSLQNLILQSNFLKKQSPRIRQKKQKQKNMYIENWEGPKGVMLDGYP